ncbi:hypothetical protein, partial [Bartonella silvatica]|uniref:hypothetical protein n=1 Tax=Bartonella silvatica TaxID=357760 RepID=UPI0033972D10
MLGALCFRICALVGKRGTFFREGDNRDAAHARGGRGGGFSKIVFGRWSWRGGKSLVGCLLCLWGGKGV